MFCIVEENYDKTHIWRTERKSNIWRKNHLIISELIYNTSFMNTAITKNLMINLYEKLLNK